MADHSELRQRRLIHDALQSDLRTSLRSKLYRSARLLDDVQAVASGNPTRRAKNKFVGRTLGRSGFWRFLWR